MGNSASSVYNDVYNYGSGNKTVSNDPATATTTQDISPDISIPLSPEGLDAPTLSNGLLGGERIYSSYNAVVDVPRTAEMMSLHKNNLAPVKEGHFGVDRDELMLQDLQSRYVRHASIDWTQEMTPGQFLTSGSLSPFQSAPYDGSDELSMSPMEFYSLLAAFWRGDLVIRVEVVASKFHAGMLFLGLHYGEYSDLSTWSINRITGQYGTYIDIREGITEWSLKADYKASTPWLNTYNVFNSSMAWSMGQYSLVVINKLTAPDSVAANVPVNIYMAAGTNFSLHYPLSSNNMKINDFDPYFPVPLLEISNVAFGSAVSHVGFEDSLVAEPTFSTLHPLDLFPYSTGLVAGSGTASPFVTIAGLTEFQQVIVVNQSFNTVHTAEVNDVTLLNLAALQTVTAASSAEPWSGYFLASNLQSTVSSSDIGLTGEYSVQGSVNIMSESSTLTSVLAFPFNDVLVNCSLVTAAVAFNSTLDTLTANDSPYTIALVVNALGVITAATAASSVDFTVNSTEVKVVNIMTFTGMTNAGYNFVATFMVPFDVASATATITAGTTFEDMTTTVLRRPEGTQDYTVIKAYIGNYFCDTDTISVTVTAVAVGDPTNYYDDEKFAAVFITQSPTATLDKIRKPVRLQSEGVDLEQQPVQTLHEQATLQQVGHGQPIPVGECGTAHFGEAISDVRSFMRRFVQTSTLTLSSEESYNVSLLTLMKLHPHLDYAQHMFRFMRGGISVRVFVQSDSTSNVKVRVSPYPWDLMTSAVDNVQTCLATKWCGDKVPTLTFEVPYLSTLHCAYTGYSVPPSGSSYLPVINFTNYSSGSTRIFIYLAAADSFRLGGFIGLPKINLTSGSPNFYYSEVDPFSVFRQKKISDPLDKIRKPVQLQSEVPTTELTTLGQDGFEASHSTHDGFSYGGIIAYDAKAALKPSRNVVSNSDHVRHHMPETPWTVASLIRRPAYASTLEWSTADGVGHVLGSFAVPFDLFANSITQLPFVNFRFLRFEKIVVRLKINASPMHSGRLVAFFQPGVTNSLYSAAYNDIAFATSLDHHVMLNPAEATTIDLEIPFMHPLGFLHLTDSDISESFTRFLGFVRVVVFNPLDIGTSGATSVTINLRSIFVDAQPLVPVAYDIIN